MNKILFILIGLSLVGCKAQKEYLYVDKFHSKIVLQRDTIIKPIQIDLDGELLLPNLKDQVPVTVKDSTGQTEVTFTRKGDTLDYKIKTKPAPIEIKKIYIKEIDTISSVEKITVPVVEKRSPWYLWPLVILSFAVGVYLSSIIKSVMAVPLNIIKSLFK